LQPLAEKELEINHNALVVGGGLAGLTAAKNLAEQGFLTYLIEKNEVLGGQAGNLLETWKGENVRENMDRLVHDVQSDKRINIYLKTAIKQVEGSVGNFRTTISTGGPEQVLEHGAAIIATGSSEFKPDLYLYGRNARVLTGLELDEKLRKNDAAITKAGSIAFIQCVGSRIPERQYCSKVCCTHSVVNALKLLEINPDLEVYIIYRDLRTYGLRESLYRKARAKGVHFVRYDHEKGLTVDEDGLQIKVLFTDPVIDRKIELHPDLLILATAIVPPQDSAIPQMFKVPLNDDGFYVEAHVKLRPVDFATAGVFVCGLAHGPKAIDESIAQAQAAAARAGTFLSASTMKVGGVTGEIDHSCCTGCGVCVAVCPYQAINLNEKVKAEINEAVCQGCGLCSSSCRSGAASLRGFSNQAVFAQISGF